MKDDQPDSQDAPWKPVLGLSNEPGLPLELPVRSAPFFDQPEPETRLELTVIVPARNEEDCIGACLESLVAAVRQYFRAGPRLGTDRR